MKKQLISDNRIEEIRKSITVPGLSGLSNLGNTCYMNSALQCILATNLLIPYFLKKEFHEDLLNNIKELLAQKVRNVEGSDKDEYISVDLDDIIHEYKNSITYNLYKLMKVVWQNNQEITPITFKKIIGKTNSIFNGYNQNDSQEFLSFVLDKVHDELKREVNIVYNNIPENVKKYDMIRRQYNEKILEDINIEDKEKIINEFKEYKKKHISEVAIQKYIVYWKKYLEKSHSIINDIFMGTYYTEIICNECKNQSIVFEPYNILQLSIPDNGNIDLEKCIQNFTTEEELKDKNKYKCEECNKYVNAIKKTSIWDTPDILIIQLKRFINTHNFTTKVKSIVKYPLYNFSLEKFYSVHFPRNYKYDLYGVIQHTGSLYGGHYIAHTKNFINNKWYEFNDANVIHIDDNEIEKELMSRDSYILFYKKKEYFNY